MPQSRRFCYIFFLFGVLSAAASVAVTICFLDSPPILLGTPQVASARVEELMDNICLGKFDDAEQLLYGSPDLEVDFPHADVVGDLLWDTYLDSVSYELLGECCATETGLAQQVRFVSLDISAVTDAIAPLAREMLLSRLENTRDSSIIYDENQNYRDDFISDILSFAAQQVLEDNIQYKENSFVLQMIYNKGEWLVIPDSVFLSAVFGGISG